MNIKQTKNMSKTLQKGEYLENLVDLKIYSIEVTVFKHHVVLIFIINFDCIFRYIEIN